MGQGAGERYLVEEQVGAGGVATVYRGTDTVLQRTVAIKTLNEDVDPGLKERFQVEARSVAQLNHPNIVSVYDVGEAEGLPYIVMEYVQGTNLKKLIGERGPLPPAEAVRIVSQVGSALEYAHQNGIVHCDVKPHNILILPDGRAKLADFGIAQAQVDLDSGRRDGKVYATPLYMAPEQATGEPVTPRTDVYGLGLVLWEALTGRPPEKPALNQPLALPFDEVNLPRGLEAAIRRATDPDPAARYGSVDEFASVLFRPEPRGSNDDGGRTVAMPVPARTPARREPTPNPVAAAAAPQRVARAPRARPGDAVPSGAPQGRPRWYATLPGVALAALLLGLLGTAGYGLVSAFGGAPARVPVPDLTGGTVKQARQEAAEKGLKVRVSGYQPSTEPAGTVVDQEPFANELLERDGQVGLVVARKAAAGEATRASGAVAARTTEAVAVPASTSSPTEAAPAPDGGGIDAATPAPAVDPPPVVREPGVRKIQLAALSQPVEIQATGYGRFTLQPGRTQLLRTSGYIRVRAEPSRQVLVNVDGEELGTLHDLAERFNRKPIASSWAFIQYSGPSSRSSVSNSATGNGTSGRGSDGGNRGRGGNDGDDDEGDDD